MNPEKNKRIKNAIFITVLLVIVSITILIIYEKTGLGFKCIFHSLTDLKCAGCGNTHAIKSLFSLNIKESFSYNPLYPLEFSYIAFVYFSSLKNYIINNNFNYISKNKIFDITILIIILAWWILRNIFGI